MHKLSVPAQNYAWGKSASESKVAELLRKGGGAVDEDGKYAELWMGTHVNGPARLESGDGDEEGGGKLLSDFLVKEGSFGGRLGGHGYDGEDGKLPYLFKVLSVATALSIQAHPDRSLAKALHESRPDVYKDPNHKPEMALALTDFEALCGFRTEAEIREAMSTVPELHALVGGDVEGEKTGEEYVKAVFRRWMGATSEAVAEATAALQASLDASTSPLSPIQALAKRLLVEYPRDVGVFAPWILNVITLRPGQAIFLAANEPHAYLKGNCLECMAASDNVVRAGLTPKLRDVPTLISMLTYSLGPPKILQGEVVEEGEASKSEGSATGGGGGGGGSGSGGGGGGGGGVEVRLYRPPVPEFEMRTAVFAAHSGSATLTPSSPAASMLLVLQGSATLEGLGDVKEGEVWCIQADQKVVATPTEGSACHLAWAGVNASEW